MQICSQNKKFDPKFFYAYVNSKSRGRSKVGPLQDAQGRLVEDCKGVGQLLNDFFGSVFTREDCSIILEAKNRVLNDSINDLTYLDITPEMVASHIKGFKSNKAAGRDELSSSFFKEVEVVVVKPLVTIFRKSLEVGVVPHDWKVANVTPIYKKGPRKIQ